MEGRRGEGVWAGGGKGTLSTRTGCPSEVPEDPGGVPRGPGMCPPDRP